MATWTRFAYIETKLIRCARVPVQGIIITSLIHCNQVHTSGGSLSRRSLASNNISTVIYNGKSYSDSDLANMLNDKFVAVENTLPPFTWTPLAIDDVPSDFYISVDDTEKALESLKRHTSVGLDGILSWFLRENASLISRPLASMFNASIHEGLVPPLWKCANVTSIPKCFLISDIDSDARPISLKPIVRFPSHSFITGFYNQLMIISTIYNLVQSENQAQLWH